MKLLKMSVLAMAITFAMLPPSPAEARDTTLPKTVSVHQLCNDPDMAAAVVSQMCANRKVRLAMVRELKQHPDFRADWQKYENEHPSGGG
jgi:hypothetical protein